MSEYETDLRTLVPGYRLDWSGLRSRFEDDALRLEKLTTYESRAAYLDEMARQLEDAVQQALGFWDRAIDKAERNAIGCRNCDGTGWVCENHPDKPWADGHLYPGETRMTGCDCGAGMPCQECNADFPTPAKGS